MSEERLREIEKQLIAEVERLRQVEKDMGEEASNLYHTVRRLRTELEARDPFALKARP